MKSWHLITIALCTYILALIATAPATLVDAGLQRASDGKLRLTEAQGTLWSGSGLIEIRDASGRIGLAKLLAWQFRPGSALRARLGYQVEFGQESIPFPVTIFWSRIEFKQADIRLPAAALSIGIPKLAALDLTGDVNLHVTSLSLGRYSVLGNATLQWLTAGSALSPVSPLGNYELRLSGIGHEVHATLHTLQGPLQLDGQGSWASGQNPVFLATAYTPPEFQQQLGPFLRLIAVERAAGRFELQFK